MRTRAEYQGKLEDNMFDDELPIFVKKPEAPETTESTGDVEPKELDPETIQKMEEEKVQQEKIKVQKMEDL